MPAALVDHLWQSLLFVALCAGLACLLRHNSAQVRLWMWRICAAKLLLPFALLFALGRWLGFPAHHSAAPVPALLRRAADAVTPLFAPAQSAHFGISAALLCLLALIPAAGLCAWLVRNSLRIEHWLLRDELLRRAANPDDVPPAPGFFKALLITTCVTAIAGGVLLGGAIADRRWRVDLLAVHERSLRNAPVSMAEAALGMGTRSRIEADPGGVLIRNVSIQDLVALAYGVNHYAVWGNQLISGDDPDARSWLNWPRYDVRVNAPVVEPHGFDPYALRARMTLYLVERFGFEIYVNGDCQPPCGRFDTGISAEASRTMTASQE